MHARRVLNHSTTRPVHSDLFQFIFHLFPNRKSIPIQGEVELSRVKRLKPEYNVVPSMYKVLGSSTTEKRKELCATAEPVFPHPFHTLLHAHTRDTTSGKPAQVSETLHSLCQLHESHFLHISHSICSPITLSKNKLVTSDTAHVQQLITSTLRPLEMQAYTIQSIFPNCYIGPGYTCRHPH